MRSRCSLLVGQVRDVPRVGLGVEELDDRLRAGRTGTGRRRTCRRRSGSPRPPSWPARTAVAAVPAARAVGHEVADVVVSAVGDGAGEVVALGHAVAEEVDGLRRRFLVLARGRSAPASRSGTGSPASDRTVLGKSMKLTRRSDGLAGGGRGEVLPLLREAHDAAGPGCRRCR